MQPGKPRSARSGDPRVVVLHAVSTYDARTS